MRVKNEVVRGTCKPGEHGEGHDDVESGGGGGRHDGCEHAATLPTICTSPTASTHPRPSIPLPLNRSALRCAH